MSLERKKISKKLKVQTTKSIMLIDFLVVETSLSKTQIKKTIDLGGVWLSTSKIKKPKRIRRVQTELNSGDSIHFYFDSDLLNANELLATPLFENKHFGIWYKPANMLTQGTPWGDRGTLLHQVGKLHKNVHLVHRLDKETSGLILLAYSTKSAQLFSKLWEKRQVKKVYQAVVLGHLKDDKGTIDIALDGQKAMTTYNVIEKISDGKRELTKMILEPITGRLHQIRRHLEIIGHPVIGDPQYGKGNKNLEGLQLQAYSLTFTNPITNENQCFELPSHLALFSTNQS